MLAVDSICMYVWVCVKSSKRVSNYWYRSKYVSAANLVHRTGGYGGGVMCGLVCEYIRNESASGGERVCGVDRCFSLPILIIIIVAG